MIKLGEAAYDENGNTSYGQPGDQTGLEVRISDFYINPSKPWQLVFRAKKQEHRDKLALSMQQACLNENIGYAQYGDGTTVYKNRYGLYFALKASTNHTMSDITTPCNCDCSALVAQCCIAAGINVSIYMSTSSEIQILNNTGLFDQIPFTVNMPLLSGDILWRQGHTAIITQGIDKGYNKTPKWVAAATQSCNVYLDPDTNSSLLPAWKHLGVGNLVDVCDEVGNFYFVRIAGIHYGFVLMSCLAAPKPEPTPEPEPTSAFQEFIGAPITLLNLRTAPTSSAPYCNIDRNDKKGVRHTINKDEEVLVVDELNGWYQLKIIGAVETWYPFCSGKYLKKVRVPQPEPPKEIHEGDNIRFIGNTYYTSAYGGKAASVQPFDGSCLKIYKGTKHPYLVVSTNHAKEGYADEKDVILR